MEIFVKSIIFNSIDTSVGNFLMSVDNQEFDVICSMQINSWGGQKARNLFWKMLFKSELINNSHLAIIDFTIFSIRAYQTL